ncbi:MAG: NapC/NirT family cytochrome c [Burkholderiaceae bacterium]|nr:NapC/NirT family cytochrome c [Burkholderiaceae bacterium]
MTNLLATLRRRWKLALGLALIGVFAAMLLVIGGAYGLAVTSTEEFCIGCHEMRNNVYAEYKGTIHDTNRSGVRAICTDCHVPHEPVPLILRKMRATFEVIGHLRGIIDTKEKFEAHRALLAQRVWTRMLETDSHECRNCHVAEKMDQDKQTEKAQARHAKAQAEGWTCIECHYGIAHTEPVGPGPQELREKLKLARVAAAASVPQQAIQK